MKRFTVWLIVVFVLFTLSACGGGEEEPTATPSPTEAPAQAAQPTATEAPAQPATEVSAPAADVPGAPSLAEDAFGQLSSYRSNITWSVSNGGNITQQVTMNIAETAQPNARQINMTSNEGEFAVIQIEDTLYVNVGGMWQQLPAAGAAAMMGQLIFTPEDLTDMATGSDATFEFIGSEQVNGIDTNHYRLTFDPNNLPEGMAVGEVTDLNAEIWVADQADLPSFAVRMQVSYTGDFEGQTGSAFNLLWDVSEVNSGLVIEAPN
ncbi:hypothetical protein GC175_03515 [bacterium]|nr:hypothetical protein [bacterium]